MSSDSGPVKPLEKRCLRPGLWIVEGFHLERSSRAAYKHRWWYIYDPGDQLVGQRVSLDRALEFVREILENGPQPWSSSPVEYAQAEREGLAQAACDTIAKAAQTAHRNWCNAAVDWPEVVPSSSDAICCPLDVRNASNRPASCAS